jgi:DNA-binding transcriptional regulator YbjK
MTNQQRERYERFWSNIRKDASKSVYVPKSLRHLYGGTNTKHETIRKLLQAFRRVQDCLRSRKVGFRELVFGSSVRV